MNVADATAISNAPTSASEGTDPHFVGGIAETKPTVRDSVMPQLAADIAVRARDRNSIIATIMQVGHLDRAQADQVAEAIDVM